MVDLWLVLDWLGFIILMEVNEYIGFYYGVFFMCDWCWMVLWLGGFMFEKCCYDIDIYNMIVGL